LTNTKTIFIVLIEVIILNEFVFSVEDVFYISGKGTVVTGRVQYGTGTIGQTVFIQHPDGTFIETEIIAIEQFRKTVTEIHEGECCGLLLKGISKADVGRGFMIVPRLPDGYISESRTRQTVAAENNKTFWEKIFKG
jgi:translation elongation factor EF-Tu-like GTPase